MSRHKQSGRGDPAFMVIGIVTVLVLVIGALIFSSSSDTSSAGPSGGPTQLTAPEKLYDFGTISMKNGLVNHIFRVTNSSDEDIYVKKVTTSCMCTKAYMETASGEKGPFGMEGMGYVPPANEIMKAGESRDIKVVYDPNAHGPAGVGAIDRFVYLTDASGGTLNLEIKAVVTP